MGLGEDHPSKGVGLSCNVTKNTGLLVSFRRVCHFTSKLLHYHGSFYGVEGALHVPDVLVFGILLWDEGKHPSGHGCGAVCIWLAQGRRPHTGGA